MLNTTQLREHHPAWQILSATKGPQVIAVLHALFKDISDGVHLDDATLELAQMLQDQFVNGENSSSEDYILEARREIRQWIKRGLLSEHQEQLFATDALESVFRFVQSLDNRIMSSSASRLSIVQREIEYLEANLNSNPEHRANFLKDKINELQRELEIVESGHVEVLSEDQAIEAIREIYSLASSLSQDFRRVEDSYREADRMLRQSIISEQSNRGSIVDNLLDSHDELLETQEGKVFNGFLQQLQHELEMDKTKKQLSAIASHPTAIKALNNKEQSDLRWMILRLIKESQGVVRARAQTEKDVRGFLQTGLAAEHHKMGKLLNDFFAQAIQLDWTKQANRKADSTLPPVGFSHHVPAIERLRFKEIHNQGDDLLDLRSQKGSLNELNDEFWDSFDGLNQELLLSDTLELLSKQSDAMSISQIAKSLPPSHDLESVCLWLSMAMASDTVLPETESVDITQEDDSLTRFTVPKVTMTKEKVDNMEFEI